MNELHAPWLQAALLIPLAGAVVAAGMRDANRARIWCLACIGASLGLVLAAWIDFSLHATAAVADRWDLLALVAGRAMWQVDELSAPLLPLTALLHLLTVLATLNTKVRRFSYAWTLVSLALALAAFSSADRRLLVAALGLATLPPWFEMRARGKNTRVYAMHMAVAWALMASGIWAITQEPQAGSANWATGCVLLGLLVRRGVPPLHGWAAELFEHATFGSALLFLAPMTGVYGVLRLVVPFASEGLLRGLGIWSLTAAVYLAGLALVQREPRRLYVCLFLSQTCLVLAGTETVSTIGLTGALCVWPAAGLTLTGLGLTLRALEARHGRLALTRYLGLYDHTPLLAVCFLLTGMASVGFPGTLGFLGMELLVDGAVQTYPHVGVAVVVAAALNAIAMVRAYLLLFTGARHVSQVSLQVVRRERIAVWVLATLILGGALYPQPGIHSRYEAARHLLESSAAGNAAASMTSVHAESPEAQP